MYSTIIWMKSNGGENIAEKSMLVAMLISFFLSGLGLVYAGDVKKGLILFAIIVIFNILYYFVNPILGMGAFIAWIYSLYATYKQVNLVNGVA